MANTIETRVLRNPFGVDTEVIVFNIDDPDSTYVLKDVVPEAGEYTFSGFFRSKSGNLVMDPDGNFTETPTIIEIGGSTIQCQSSWGKIKVCRMILEKGDLDIAFPVGTFYLYHPQLEKGTIATDYAPAPEDYEARIEATSRKISMLVKSGESESSLELTDKALEVIADNIVLTGNTTFKDALIDIKSDLAEPDETKRKYITGINGGIITTGIVKSVDAEMDDDGEYTKQGIIIDLDNETIITPWFIIKRGGSIVSPEFSISGKDGKAEFSGALKAASGSFEGKLEGNEIEGADIKGSTITGSDVSADVMTAKDKYLIHNESGEDKELASTNNPDDEATGMWDTLQLANGFNFLKLMGILFNRVMKTIIAQDWTIYANTSGEHSGTINKVRPSNMTNKVVKTSTTTSLASSTWSEIQSLSLDAGTYLIKASCIYPDGSSSVSGRRCISLSSGTSYSNAPDCMDRRPAVAGGTSCEKIRIVQSSSNFTIRVFGWQNSGSAMEITNCYISYVKLL